MVSVVMPCYNGGSLVPRGISSVLDQTLQSFELLFLDDGSTDGSADLASCQTDSRVRVVRLAHAGVSNARNRGIAEASGQFIAFLDVDDAWHPEFLAKMTARLAERPECAVAYCGWQNVGVTGGRGLPYVPRTLDGVAHPDHLLACCPWPIHAALTRTAAVRAANGFDRSLAVGEDFLLWLEIACFHPIVLVPEVLSFYHHDAGQQATRHALRAAMQPFLAQQLFLARHPSIRTRLGRRRVRELTLGRLLQKGYESYWKGDLDTARPIFRRVVRSGYGQAGDWLYTLPSLLPEQMHRQALRIARALRGGAHA